MSIIIESISMFISKSIFLCSCINFSFIKKIPYLKTTAKRKQLYLHLRNHYSDRQDHKMVQLIWLTVALLPVERMLTQPVRDQTNFISDCFVCSTWVDIAWYILEQFYRTLAPITGFNIALTGTIVHYQPTGHVMKSILWAILWGHTMDHNNFWSML